MTALEKEVPAAAPPFDPKQASEALDRGEIVRLLAKLKSGQITPEQLLPVLEAHYRRHRLRCLLHILLGR